MLESLVEKLLNKFLAPYVEGIERNLHLGVWSGNIVLENLKLKPQITEILDLSFKIIHGNIGRINIQIPWSKLGKSPVCVLIKSVHIYIKPRSYRKNENVIIEELRKAKMHRLELLEEEISIIKQQKNREKSSEKSTLIFKLLNKIINNIQIDIQDILIHFEDPEKNFSIGFILKSSSVKNCLNKDENVTEVANSSSNQNANTNVNANTNTNANVKANANANTNANEEHKKLNHIIEFKGLCIYSNSNIRKKRKRKKWEREKKNKNEKEGKKEESDNSLSDPKNFPKKKDIEESPNSVNIGENAKDENDDWKNASSVTNNDIKVNNVNEKMKDFDFSSKMKGDLSISYDKNSYLTFESKLGSGEECDDDGDDNNKDNYLKRTLSQISHFLRDDDNKILNYYNFEYLIKPFDLVLPVEQSSNKKELKAKLEIGEKWEGITLTRTQITKIIEIMNEANKSRNQTNKLLLKHACTVKLDIESLRNETKNEFMNLYNKVLAEKYNISTTELTTKELNRLQILYDVVGVRHLAKWRLQCRNMLEKIIEEKNLKKKYLYDSIYKQQSWWAWVTGNKKDIENKVQSILKSEQDIINEKELYILQEAMTNDDNYDVVLPTKYDFQFKLANFSINVYDDCRKRRKKNAIFHLNKGEHGNRNNHSNVIQVCGNQNDDKLMKGISKEMTNHQYEGNEDGDVITNKYLHRNDINDDMSQEMFHSGSSYSMLNSSTVVSSTNSNYIKEKMKCKEINILSINFYQIYSSLSLQSVVDHNDNDNFQWKFIIELQNFVAKHKNKVFMEFRTNKNSYSYNVNNTGSTIYQNPIYYSLIHSQSLCAYVEINHLVTEKGNTLSTLLRLNPLELYLSPLLIKNILSFAFPLIDIINKKQASILKKNKGKDSVIISAGRDEEGGDCTQNFINSDSLFLSKKREEDTLDLGSNEQISYNTHAEESTCKQLVGKEGLAKESLKDFPDEGNYKDDEEGEKKGEEKGEEEEGEEERGEEEYDFQGYESECDEMDDEDNEALIHIKKMEHTELIEGLKEKGENVYNRAVQHLPELFEFYIHICGPILHFDNLTNGIVELHLGNLIAKTECPCTYHKFNLIFEFNETQITCLKTSTHDVQRMYKGKIDAELLSRKEAKEKEEKEETEEVELDNEYKDRKREIEKQGEKVIAGVTPDEEVYLNESYCNNIKEKALENEKFHILQPIPVKVYVEYNLKILKTNIILDGIFFQINPDAVSIIMAVPTSITRYLTRFYSKNKKEKDLLKNRKRISSVEKKDMCTKGEANISLDLPCVEKHPKKNSESSIDVVVNVKDANMNMTEFGKTNKLEEESFLYDIDFLIKNSAFSIKNGKNREVLKYEACGISYKNYLQKKKKIVKIEIEQLWICDPSNRQPIFFTLTKNVNSKDIFLFRSLSTYLEEKHNAMIKGVSLGNADVASVGAGVLPDNPHTENAISGDSGVNNKDNILDNKIDNNNNNEDKDKDESDCLERFQSAQRVEEYMMMSSSNEGQEYTEKKDDNFHPTSFNPNCRDEKICENPVENGESSNEKKIYSYRDDKNTHVNIVSNESRNNDVIETGWKDRSEEMEKKEESRRNENEDRVVNHVSNDADADARCDDDGIYEEEDDDFMDAIEEKQLSINLQIVQKKNEINKAETHINFIISDIELHWKYKTIKQIFRTMKEYKKKLQYGIEKDMKYIKNKLKNEMELKNYKMFISEHTLRSVQETLKNVKNSLNILDLESTKKNDEEANISLSDSVVKTATLDPGKRKIANSYLSPEKQTCMEHMSGNNCAMGKNSPNVADYDTAAPVDIGTSTNEVDIGTNTNEVDIGTNTNEVDIDTATDDILSNGLNNTLPKLQGQKSSYVKYFFNCYIKSASLAFWQKRKIFSKIQVSNIYYENKVYLNFDQKMFVNIEKGIISINSKNIISNNIDDYTYDLFISKKSKKHNSTDMDSIKQNEECKVVNMKSLCERRNSKDIWNYINVDNLSEEIKKKKKRTNKQKKHDLFVGKVKVYNDKRNYNICLLCDISSIYYIFYLRDLKLFLEYLDDGILNVFISKSYKKVVQVAQTKYFLFHCTILDPVVIIPEDKNIIYNYRGKVKDTSMCSKVSSSLGEKVGNAKGDENAKGDVNAEKDNNNIPYIESYLKFHIDTLKFKNSYTVNCTEEIILNQRNELNEKRKKRRDKRLRGVGWKIESKQEQQRGNVSSDKGGSSAPKVTKEIDSLRKNENKNNGIANGGQSKYDFTLYIDLLNIESRACENGGSTNIEGNILQKVNIALCLVSTKDGVCIYLNGNNLYLDLTIFQLSFLLDIINENFCYKGYFPMCFICDKGVDIHNMLNVEWFRKGNINLGSLNMRSGSSMAKCTGEEGEIEKYSGNPNSHSNGHLGDEPNSHVDSTISNLKENLDPMSSEDREIPKGDTMDGSPRSKEIIRESKNEPMRKNGLKLYVYINLESLRIKTSFDVNTPIAVITFKNISISFHLVLLDFYYIYFFDLYSNSLYIDDVRKNSINYYKRVAYCCIQNEVDRINRKKKSKKSHIVRNNVQSNVSSLTKNNNVSLNSISLISNLDEENNMSSNQVISSSALFENTTSGEWNIMTMDDNHSKNKSFKDAADDYRSSSQELNDYKILLRYMFENNVFLNEKKKKKKQKGIKIKINSFIEDILLSIELDDAYICFFFIIFIDIYKFLSMGFKLSTLHLYPKPSPYIVSYRDSGKKKKGKKSDMQHKQSHNDDLPSESKKEFNSKEQKINTHSEINQCSKNLKKYDFENIMIEEDVFKMGKNESEDDVENHVDEGCFLSDAKEEEEKEEDTYLKRKNKKYRDKNLSDPYKFIREGMKDEKNQIITNINEILKLDNKPTHINFKVTNGNFIIFTDLENVAHPILMWSNNFVFSFSLLNKCIIFRKIYAIDSKINRINYVSNSQNKEFKRRNSKDVSNPLHNYHKKKILLCDNLNVKGEALYESVDTKKENYILKPNLKKKDYPEFISVFEVDINIGKFDIRLSNDDVEILLRASSTLFGDVPSSYTNIAIGTVIPPVKFIHRKIKNKFMRNNIYFVMKQVGDSELSSSNNLRVTNINKLKKGMIRIRTKEKILPDGVADLKHKEKALMDGEDISADTYKPGTEKGIIPICMESKGNVNFSETKNRVLESFSYNMLSEFSIDSNSISCSDSSYTESYASNRIFMRKSIKENESESELNRNNNETTNTYRDIKIMIRLHNVKCTFIDDIRNSIVPIIRMILSMNISLNFYTDECSYNINDLNSKVEYFNNCIGEWEPFLEKCNISLDVHKILSNDMYSEESEYSKSPISIIKINSVKALWFNVTPQLINLLFLFLPLFTEKVLNGLKKKENRLMNSNTYDMSENQAVELSFMNNNYDGTSTELDDKKLNIKCKNIYEDCSSVFESVSGDMDVNKSTDFHLDDFLKKEVNRNNYNCVKHNSVVYYVNLTSDYFYAFVMPEGNIEQMKNKRACAMLRSKYKIVNERGTPSGISSITNGVKLATIEEKEGIRTKQVEGDSKSVSSCKLGEKQQQLHGEGRDKFTRNGHGRSTPEVFAKIITTKELISLDRLLVNEIANNSLIEKKYMYLYLIPIPPTNVVNAIHDMFPIISKKDIVLDLMITKNPKKTIDNLVSYNQIRGGENRGRKYVNRDFSLDSIAGAEFFTRGNISTGVAGAAGATGGGRRNEAKSETLGLEEGNDIEEKYNGSITAEEGNADERNAGEKTIERTEIGVAEIEKTGCSEVTELRKDNSNSSISNYDLSWEEEDEEKEIQDEEESSTECSVDNEKFEEINSFEERHNKCENYYFKYKQRKEKDLGNSTFAPNKFVGPFLKNCECVIINLIKNSCTTLATSMKSSNVIHLLKPRDFIFEEKSRNAVIINNRGRKCNKISNSLKDEEKKNDALVQNLGVQLNKENIEKVNKWEMLNEELIKQTNMAYRHRLKHNYLPQTSLRETVCEIISPMPNYKILFMSSTVRILNKCGIPLEFCFFDVTKNPILLTSLENRTIPISTLYPNHSDSFKNYKVSNSLNINPNIKLRQKNNNLSFTVILNHEHLLSTPECAFCGPSHVYMSFKPINLVSEENDYYEIVSSRSVTEGNGNGNGGENGKERISSRNDINELSQLDYSKRKAQSSKDELKRNNCDDDKEWNDMLLSRRGTKELLDTSSINCEKGWSDIFSSDVNQGTYVKKCQLRDNNNYLYFLVKIENKISALPAEKNIKIITIYPHVSVVNAIPALVDIIITSEISEEKQNDYVYEEKGKIDTLKNNKVRLMRQCEEINAYLSKIASVKMSSSRNSSSGGIVNTFGDDYVLGKGAMNNEGIYMQELNRLENEICNIEEEIKEKKKKISSCTSNMGYVNKRLNPFSIFYIYEIRKYNCLNMKMKIGNSQCEWSEKLYLVEDDEESVMRFTLNFKRFASVEVELIKNFSGYFNSLSSIVGNKQLYIFSLPRCFIDRTGLGIKVINSNKYYPIINGITLLGDNSQIDLLLPHKTYNNEFLRSCRSGGKSYDGVGIYGSNDYDDIFNDFNYPTPVDNSPILFKATLPPIGSYTETSVECKNFFYTFCLNTEKIKTTNIPYIISRIVTVVPQFIISNKLNYPILIKQFQMDKVQGIRKNDTCPLYFPKKQNILLFRFKTLENVKNDAHAGGYVSHHDNSHPSDKNNNESRKNKCQAEEGNKMVQNYNKVTNSNGSPFWSSVIFPSENFVGTNYMVVSNHSKKEEKSDVYIITCIPDLGLKNIIIEKLDKNMNKGFIAYNCSRLAKYFRIRTFHDDMKHLKQVEDENYNFEKNILFRNFLNSSDIEHYFNIEYDEHMYLGWVNPFIYVTRNIQIEIVLHNMKTIPRIPFILRFAQFNYSQKIFHVYCHDVIFIISIEYIQDLITIKLKHRMNIVKGVIHEPTFSASGDYGGCDSSGVVERVTSTYDIHDGERSSKNSLDIQKEYNKIEALVDGYQMSRKNSNEISMTNATSLNIMNPCKDSSYIQRKMIGTNEYNYVKYGIDRGVVVVGGGGDSSNNSSFRNSYNGYNNKNHYYYYQHQQQHHRQEEENHGNKKEESVKMISSTYKNVHIIINITQIGVSIISNILKEEVFFIELSKLCALFYMKNEEEVIDIKITDVQVDCQLESCEKCVLLANRGICTNGDSGNAVGGITGGGGIVVGGNSENELKRIKSSYNQGSKIDNRTSDSSVLCGKGSYYMSEMDEVYDCNNRTSAMNRGTRGVFPNKGMMCKNPSEMRIVKSLNNTNEEKIFLNIYVERSFISHKDVIFKKIQISLDDIEIEMDAETLNGINLLIAEYIEGISLVQKKNLLYEEIQKWTILPVYVNYKSPDIPLAINIQYMQIDKFTLIVWCSFLLDKMHMMSDLLRIGLRILMVSGRLELLGAPVALNQEIFNNIRASLKSFYALLKDKYSHSILACLGFIVGYSSLINIPKIPLEIGRNTIGLAVYAVDNVSVGIGSFLSNLTFDSEYINRRQKERNFKTNTNMKEGLLSAVKNIGEGVLSLSNIVTKPIEGAQKEGVGGFFKGIGKGVAGSLVKPLDKVGQAVSDVTRGIKAEVSKPIGGHKYKTKRHRKPRMLWGEYGKIKEYNLHEAELRECLGLKFSKNIMKCLTIHKQENHPPAHYSMLFYPKVIIYANLYANMCVSTKNNEFLKDKKVGSASGAGAAGAGSGGNGGGGDIVIWSLKVEDISEIRASSHGLIIKTGNSNNLVYKIPCNNALLINKIYHELQNSKNSINSTIILGDDDTV
ncbi:hypothetical protein, conserved [Plasmodium gonderi]|uniref:Chorein N-terminal domain-containing protein n=1 Tax=Plasmodium gonderi TaxID=77519 RepID=A0A1Y1JHX3_PLAGO|nr:hypothetical protein, conserved [Plasmodium gonderi]GAW82111.1 hypothetical protein, conserved [Plasmodium gonderi]